MRGHDRNVHGTMTESPSNTFGWSWMAFWWGRLYLLASLSELTDAPVAQWEKIPESRLQTLVEKAWIQRRKVCYCGISSLMVLELEDIKVFSFFFRPPSLCPLVLILNKILRSLSGMKTWLINWLLAILSFFCFPLLSFLTVYPWLPPLSFSVFLFRFLPIIPSHVVYFSLFFGGGGIYWQAI